MSSREKTIDLLAKCVIFDHLKDDELDEVVGFTRRRTHAKGDTIFWENDGAGSVYVIAAGQVRIERNDDEGRAQLLAVRREGDMIGELSRFADIPRTADAVAETEVEILVIDGTSLDQLLDRSPTLARGVIRMLASKLKESMDFQRVLTWKVERRLAWALLLESEEGDPGPNPNSRLLRPKLTQEQLALRVGCTREHVARGMGTLRDAELLKAQGQRILLTDLKRLRRLQRTGTL